MAGLRPATEGVQPVPCIKIHESHLRILFRSVFYLLLPLPLGSKSFHFPALLPQLLWWDVPCVDPVRAGRRAVRPTLPPAIFSSVVSDNNHLSSFLFSTQRDCVPPPHEHRHAQFCHSPRLVLRQKARLRESAVWRRASQRPDATTGQGCGCRPSTCPPSKPPWERKQNTLPTPKWCKNVI